MSEFHDQIARYRAAIEAFLQAQFCQFAQVFRQFSQSRRGNNLLDCQQLSGCSCCRFSKICCLKVGPAIDLIANLFEHLDLHELHSGRLSAQVCQHIRNLLHSLAINHKRPPPIAQTRL